MKPITHKSVLAMAVPIMLANVTQPLLGVVDTAVIGQLPEAHYIGAVSIGALIFSLVYWGFGFLRMGTSGLAAQAWGAGDTPELTAVLARALAIAGAIGVVVVALSPAIAAVAFRLIEASAAIEGEAAVYFAIRVWSAPFALANYVILGWLIGIGAMRWAFATQLFLNLANMFLDALFVLGLGMATAGIAYGTLIAEVASALFGLIVVWRHVRQRDGQALTLAQVFDRERMRRMVFVNTDIMVRSLCLTFAFAWFAAQGARLGDVTVAANAVLLQLFFIGGYMIDGFANVTEALVGHAVGARQRDRFGRAVRVSSQWAMATGLAMSIVIVLAGPYAINLMSVNLEVRAAARVFLPWAALTPLLGAACFQLDGIFIGATRTREMRNMMVLSLAAFLGLGYGLTPSLGNHGLWAALCGLFVARGLTLYARLPALERAAFRA